MPILRKDISAGTSMCLGVAGAGRRAGTFAAWYSATTRRAVLSSLCSPGQRPDRRHWHFMAAVVRRGAVG
eukprot:3462386-Prymnesium_polylepis.1